MYFPDVKSEQMATPIVTSPATGGAAPYAGVKKEDPASAAHARASHAATNRRRPAAAMSAQGDAEREEIAAFVNKLANMVNDPSCDNLISWTPTGTSFCVYKPPQFAKDVLPKFFKHNNFSSFVRQLNMYGFHKVVGVEQGSLNSDDDTWEFINPNFVRDHPELMREVKRKVAPDDKGKAFSGDIKRVVEELEQIKYQQAAITNKLDNIDKNNQSLWDGMLALRHRHQRQEQTIRKILQFLASVYSSDRSALNAPPEPVPTGPNKRRRLMIEAAPLGPPLMPSSIPLDGYSGQLEQPTSPYLSDVQIGGASFNAGGSTALPSIPLPAPVLPVITPTYAQLQSSPIGAARAEAVTGIPVASTVSVAEDINNVQREIDAFQQSLLDGSYGFDIADLASLSSPAPPQGNPPPPTTNFPIPLAVDLLEELSRLNAINGNALNLGGVTNGGNLVEYRQGMHDALASSDNHEDDDRYTDGEEIDETFSF
eukprot:Opistho-2@60130